MVALGVLVFCTRCWDVMAHLKVGFAIVVGGASLLFA